VISADEHYNIDNRRIVAVGYSNGANIAASMLMLCPKVLSAALLFRAMVPLVPDKQPDLSSKSVFISAGSFDPIVPALQTKRLAELLRDAGANVTVHSLQSGHELTRDDVDLARHWLADLR
jgi:predicted esterase